MPIVRVLKPLSKGFNTIIPAGTILNLNWLNEAQVAKLEQVGAIGRISSPPLAKLPGWTLRAKRLTQAGIFSAEQLLEADEKALAEEIQANPRTIKQWKDELLGRWLVVPGQPAKKR